MLARLPLRLLNAGAAVALLCTTALLSTCVDGNRATDILTEGKMAMVALNPVLNPALAVEGTGDVNFIRITAYLAGTDSIVGQTEVPVDPQATEWELDVSVLVPTGPDPKVTITVELIYKVGAQETVQWSGETGPISVGGANPTPTVENVQVVRGGLENLTVTAVTINGHPSEIMEGETLQLNATVSSSDPASSPEVFWASSTPGVAGVSGQGMVTGLSAGTALIVATAGPAADSTNVRVVPRPSTVEVTPGEATLGSLGEEAAFVAVVLDARGNPVPGETVGWSVEDPSVLENVGGGVFRALARGSTVVTATQVNAPNLTGTALVTVRQEVASVEVTPEEATLTAPGATTPFEAVAYDALGSAIDGMAFHWSTSDETVAVMDAEGVATGMGVGVVTVYAQAEEDVATAAGAAQAPTPGTRGEATLTVTQEVAEVVVTPAAATLDAITGTVRLIAEARDAQGNVMTGVTFSWSSSDEAIVSVDADGMATAEADGTATVTATAGDLSGSAEVTVAQNPVILEWAQQPTDALADSPITPAPTVQALDRMGFLVSSFSGMVEVEEIRGTGPEEVGGSPFSISGAQKKLGTTNAPLGGSLSLPSPLDGDTRVQADGGVATFSNIFFTSDGVFQLKALSDGFLPVESDPFEITEDATDLAITKTASHPTPPEGDTITFTIVVENQGTRTATGVEVQDLPDSGLTYVSHTLTGGTLDLVTLRWVGPDIPAGGADTLRVKVAIDFGTAGSTLTNQVAIVAMDQVDPNATNNSAQAGITVDQPDLELSKATMVSPISEGDQTEFRIDVVQRSTTTAATGVQVTDILPAGLTYVSDSTSQGLFNHGTGIWNLGTVPAGIDTYSLWITVSADGGTAGSTIDNTATISSMDQTDASPGDNSGTASVQVTASPQPRSYTAPGNTELVGGAYPAPSTPHVTDPTNVLAGTPGLTVTSLGPFSSTNGGTVVMEADGDFLYTPAPSDLAALDQFTYTVNTGASAVVTVTKEDIIWWVNNANPNPPGTGISSDPFVSMEDAQTAQAAAAPAQPTIPQPEGQAGEEGPQPTGPMAETVFFLHTGNSRTPGMEYDGNFLLGTNQRLQGEGQGLSLGSFPNLVPANGLNPVKTNTGGDAIGMGSGSTLSGVDLLNPTGASIYADGVNGFFIDHVNVTGGTGVALLNSTGTLILDQVQIQSATNTALQVEGGNPVVEFDGSMIQGPGGPNPHLHFLRVLNTAGGSVTLAGGPFTDEDSGLGPIIIDGATGTVDVQMPVTITNGGGAGITVMNSDAGVTFANVTVSSSSQTGIRVENNSAGVTFNDVDITTNGGVGVSANTNTGALTITQGTVNTTDHSSLDIQDTPFHATLSSVVNNNSTANTGGGIYLWNTTPGTVNIGTLSLTSNGQYGGAHIYNAGIVNVTDPGSSISSTGKKAISVQDTEIDLTFNTVSSAGPVAAALGYGISLENVTGQFTANGGTISDPTITNTPSPTMYGIGVRVSGGNADVTYDGNIANGSPESFAVQVSGRSGGVVSLGGDIVDSARGIRIGGDAGANPGGEVKFGGTLTLTGPGEGGHPPFYASAMAANGSVEVTGTGNVIAPPAGYPALEITNTTIGPGGVTFESINVDGDPGGPAPPSLNGIVVQNTGAGSFSVTGDGVNAGSGGTLENIYGDGAATGHGIVLAGTQGVSLNHMTLNWSQGHGISASGVTDLTFNKGSIALAGEGTESYDGLSLLGTSGVLTVQGSTIQDTGRDCIRLFNSAGTVELNIDASALHQCGGETPGNGLNLYESAATTTVNVFNGSTFSSAADGDGIYAVVGGTAQVTAYVDGSGAANAFTDNGNGGITSNTSSSGSFDLTVIGGNTFDGNPFPIYLWQTGGSQTKFDINGNTFSNGSMVAQFLADGGSTASSTLEGRFVNNTATGFVGVPQLVKTEVDGDAQGVVLLDGNDLTSTSTGAGDGVVASLMGSGLPSLDFTAINNTVSLDNINGSLLSLSSANPSQAAKLCTNISNNTLGPPGYVGGTAIRTGLARLLLEDHTTNYSRPTDGEVGGILYNQNSVAPSGWGASGVVAYINTGNRVEGMRPNTCKKPFTALPTGEADIEIRKKAAPSTGTMGEPVTWTVVVKNRGPGTATNVTVGDSVRAPRSAPWVASQGSFSPGTPGDTIWNVGTLAPGDSAVMTAVGGTIPESNTAWLISLSESDPNPGNDVAHVDVLSGPAAPEEEAPAAPAPADTHPAAPQVAPTPNPPSRPGRRSGPLRR